MCSIETKVTNNSTIKFHDYNSYSSIRKNASGGLYVSIKPVSFVNDIEVTEVSNTDNITTRVKISNNEYLRIILVYGPQVNDMVDDRKKFFDDLDVEITRQLMRTSF